MTPILVEYLRPWKLVTFATGLALSVVGALYFQVPDWDVPISIIMAVLAYLTAPWSMRVILERRWRSWPVMLLVTWFTVDGCYTLYWYYRTPAVLDLMRSANFPISLLLYAICGLLWYYNGTAVNLWNAIRRSAVRRAGLK